MFAIIRTRWQTRPLSRRAKPRSSAAPGSLRKKYTDVPPPKSWYSSQLTLPHLDITESPYYTVVHGPVLSPLLRASECRRPQTRNAQLALTMLHTSESSRMNRQKVVLHRAERRWKRSHRAVDLARREPRGPE